MWNERGAMKIFGSFPAGPRERCAGTQSSRARQTFFELNTLNTVNILR
jgi:hypothetical protein